MAMNDRPEINDDSITVLLEGRAARAKTDGLLASVRLAAASTTQRRPGRFGFGLGLEFVRGPLAAVLAGAASLVLLVIALGLASGGHVPGVASPSDRPSANGSPLASASAEPPATPVPPAAAGPVLPLTVDQLNSLIQTNPGALSGRQLAITGTVARCVDRGRCPAVILVGSTPQLGVERVGGSSEAPWADGSVTELTGPFVAVLKDLHTLTYEQPLGTTADGGAFLPSQLPDPSETVTLAQDWLVRGWIAGPLGTTFCAFQPAPTPSGPQYGCGREAVLTDLPMQVALDKSITPGMGIRVQNDAYGDFAQNPGAPGTHSITDLATFLVHATCCTASQVVGPSGSLLVAANHWQIVARLDPWPVVVVPQPTPSVEPPAPSPDPGIAVQPLTVDQLNLFMRMNSQSPSGRQLVITGTIERKSDVVVLSGSDPVLQVNPVGDRGPGPWDVGGAPLTGAFAATMTDGFVLDYQGPVSTTLDGGAWLPSQLPLPSAPNVAVGYWLVHGWISGPTLLPTCGVMIPATPYPGPQYTCPAIALSDRQSGATGGSIRVQDEAYQRFAPSPSTTGSEMQPEQATFLVNVFQIPRCGPTQDCMGYPGDYQWAIVARIDPWPVPALP